MGLDAVELVLAWEEKTGACLTDAELAAIRTPEDAFRILRSKIDDSPAPGCAGHKAFCEIRRILVDAGHPRDRIKPSTSILSLGRAPRELIASIHGALGISDPAGLSPVFLWLGGGVLIVLGWTRDPPSLLLILAGAFVAVPGIHLALRKPGIATIGDLARRIATTHRGRYQSSATDDELRDIIRETTIEQLALKDGAFGWDKRFVQDLGMD